MRTFRIILAGVVGLCLVAVAGHRLAGAAETPSLGGPIVVVPSITSGDAGRPAAQARTTTSVTRTPPPTAAPVPPPPVQDAGDDDPDDDPDGD